MEMMDGLGNLSSSGKQSEIQKNLGRLGLVFPKVPLAIWDILLWHRLWEAVIRKDVRQ